MMFYLLLPLLIFANEYENLHSILQSYAEKNPGDSEEIMAALAALRNISGQTHDESQYVPRHYEGWKIVENWKMLSEDPKVLVIPNFVSDEEITHMVELGETRMARSPVVSTTKISESRTSYSAFLKQAEDEVVAAIEERCSTVALLPRSHIEPLQVLRYDPGQFFKAHYDYFSFTEDNPKSIEQFHQNMALGGQRKYTILIYLSDLEADQGGETNFPNLNISVRPQKGSALVWADLDPLNKPDPRTLHEGRPTINAVKHAINVWIRERPYPHRGRSEGQAGLPENTNDYSNNVPATQPTAPKKANDPEVSHIKQELAVLARESQNLLKAVSALTESLQRLTEKIDQAD